MSIDIDRLKTALADRYAIEREIGRGGMATVYLARDLKHERQVAIKVLQPELASSLGSERFLREIETAAKLNHPYVLPLYDSGEADGFLYYVMPYMDGDSLRDRLNRDDQLPVEDAVRIAGEVAGGLDYAHEQGVVHRDIKPGNIMLSAEHAVIADFGIARAVSEAGGERVTKTGVSLGSPTYMSPEQASGSEMLDGRSDIYSLGCVLYEMLAGEPPYTGKTAAAILARKSLNAAPSLRAMRETVPPGVEHAVAKALAKAPADRFVTAGQFAGALEAASEAHEATGHGRRASLGRRSGGIAIGLAVLSIAVFAVSSWLNRGRGATGEATIQSIAVLPFADMSQEGDQEYFSDGISEELLNLLAKIPGLQVAARTSSFSFKGQNLEISEIAGRLHVAHVLEGSVRKAGNKVRVTAQLVRAEDGFQMWSESWDRSLDDIFVIQDEIAADVVAQLKVTLLGAAPTVEETDPQAYALFLQARQLGRQFTTESLEQSNALLQQALAIDPDYAAAWAGLARNYSSQAAVVLRPIDEGYQLAREAAKRALAIDPGYAPAHTTLGLIAESYDGDLAAAAWHLERALKLAPTDIDIFGNAARLARNLGRLDEAIALREYTVARDPVNPTGHARLGFSYLQAWRLDEAIASYRTALSRSPGRIGVQFGIGETLLRKGEPEAALAAMQRESSEELRLIGVALAYHALGQEVESDAALAELIENYEQGWAYNIAYVLAFRGEADRAFQWLGKAVQYNDPGLAVIPVQNLFASIYDDPRWLPFLESIGKSPEQLAAIEFDVTLPK